MEMLRRTKLTALIGLILCLALLSSLLGCATTKSQYDRAAVLGTAGAAAGALLDKKNPWRGAVVGGTIGAAAGWGL